MISDDQLESLTSITSDGDTSPLILIAVSSSFLSFLCKLLIWTPTSIQANPQKQHLHQAAAMRSPATSSYLAILLALPAAITAATLDCAKIRIDKQDFDLSAIGGPKTVHYQEYDPPSIANTTFTIDICNNIKREPDIDKSKQCPMGTQVCGIEETYFDDGTHHIAKVRPIAGEFTATHGSTRALEPEWTRLKGSASNEDAEREGLRLELHGGKYPETKEGKPHKAIIEFLCDANVTGNEGFGDAKEKRLVSLAEGEGDDKGDDEVTLPDLDKGKSIQFVSFKPEGEKETMVLRLSWKTKYACEGAEKAPPAPKKHNSWGFFTWFLIM